MELRLNILKLIFFQYTNSLFFTKQNTQSNTFFVQVKKVTKLFGNSMKILTCLKLDYGKH